VEEAFPQYQVVWEGPGASAASPPPYRITFPPADQDAPAPGSTRAGIASASAAPAAPAIANGHHAEGGEGGEGGSSRPVLRVAPYVPPNMGPYPGDQPRRNSVRFTPVQVEAIRSGVQPGGRGWVGGEQGRVGGRWGEGAGRVAGVCGGGGEGGGGRTHSSGHRSSTCGMVLHMCDICWAHVPGGVCCG
jgi:hypothetical protein